MIFLILLILILQFYTIKRFTDMSEEFQNAIAALQAEIGETRAEVGRLHDRFDDLIRKVEDSANDDDAESVLATVAELDEVNKALAAIAPTPVPIDDNVNPDPSASDLATPAA